MAEVRDAIAVLRERFNKVVSENCLSVHDVAKQAEIEAHDLIDFRLGDGRNTTAPTLIKIEGWVNQVESSGEEDFPGWTDDPRLEQEAVVRGAV